MKRALKLIGWLTAAAGALLAVAALALLAPVDRTPFRELPAYARASASLEQARTASRVSFGELRAGFGRARLTPELGAERDDPARGRFRAIPLAGYGARKGQPATGVGQDLWVKAIAFAQGAHTGVVVGADALIVPREVAEDAARRVAAARGVSRGALYFGATHTHSSLGGWGRGVVAEQFAGPHTPGAAEWFARQLAAAAVTALDDLSPASAGEGSFLAPQFVRNRLRGDAAPEDPEFRLLALRQADGDTAVMGSYAAHATVLPASNFRFHGDYPGCWEETVETSSGGLALFLAGGTGSHGPRAGAPGLDGAKKMGKALGELTLQTLAGMRLTNQVCFGFVSLDIPLPPLQARIDDGVRLRPWAARSLLRVEPNTLLQGLRVGGAVWLSTPCDFSGELALDLRAAGRVRGLAVTATSFNGDYVGYVIPSAYYHLAGYEPRLMSFYGPQLPDYLADLLQGISSLLARP